MGSGLSMASVNKIKELANSKEYSLAVDILENQDLTKSLNPQFLRLCGEIYLKTNMYKEARDALVRAHKLAPEAKRVMFLFVDLYFRMGYKELAEIYYNMYLFENDENTPETKQIEYIYKKANNARYEELQEIIEPMYAHTMDYDWSFELYLLYKMQGADDKADALKEVYVATYKNTNNILVLDDISNNYVDVDTLFEVYSKDNLVDDEPEQEYIRAEEAKLLVDDDLRMNPKEAEITIVFDDRIESNVSKRKLKKLLKEQDKESEAVSEGNHESNEHSSEDFDNDTADTKKGLFKKVISKIKKNNKDENANEILSDDNTQEHDKTINEKVLDESIGEKESINKEETNNQIIEDELVNSDIDALIMEDEPAENDIDNHTVKDEFVEESIDTQAVEDEFVEESIDTQAVEDEFVESDIDTQTIEDEFIEDATEDIDSDTENEDGLLEDGDFDMRKKHSKYNKEKYDSVISVEEDDDFTAESETIDDLFDDNSFSSVSGFDDYVDSSPNKMNVVFEEAEMISDDSAEEFEVDDFSVDVEDGFGAMDSEYEESYEETVEETYEEYVEETEEIVEETVEETYEEYVEEAEEIVEETVEETYEEYVEETEEIVEETVEETYEEYVEETEEIVEETMEETYEEYVEETEETVEDTIEDINDINSYVEETKKKQLDFPVFRSSLFPEYKQDISVVENNFDEIMSEAQDKFNENKLKEEQMLKEAEALLASMGISLDNVSVTNTNSESISNVINNEPSRDDLKSSLEIDSVKKDILEQLKEYR